MIDCSMQAKQNERLLAHARKFLPEKEKVIALLDVLVSIENKLEKHGFKRSVDAMLQDINYSWPHELKLALSKAEFALLMQVSEKKHSIGFYITYLEGLIGKEIYLYEQMSQDLQEINLHRYHLIELIRHSGGSVTSSFDRLVTASEPIMDHLSLRHSLLVPDLFVVLQNQKRMLRNQQWARYKKMLNNQIDIVKRISKQLNESVNELQDVQKMIPGRVPEPYYSRVYEEKYFPLRLVSFVILMEQIVVKCSK